MRVFMFIVTGAFMALAAYCILQTLSSDDKDTAWTMFGAFIVATVFAIVAAVMGAVL